MAATAQAQPNIALIKYWGKRDTRLNLPATSSLSITLGALWPRTRVAFDTSLRHDELRLNGADDPATLARVSTCLDLLRRHAGTTTRARADSRNNFPTAAGLASSASGFAALIVAADAALGLALDRRTLSMLARQGSGSAARSLFGGFVSMSAGQREDGADAFAEPVLDAAAWPLEVAVAVTSHRRKSVRSGAGMESSRQTSPFYPTWVSTAATDLAAARDALQARDFAALADVSEHNCLKMHAVMQASRPPLAIRARVEDATGGTTLLIPRWGVEQRLQPQLVRPGSFLQSLALLLERLDLSQRSLRIQVVPEMPRAMGLGGSAALAVAVIRALDRHCALGLDDDAVCALAFECEKIVHGTPSGIDNTVATYGNALLYQRGEPAQIRSLALKQPLPLVIGLSGSESLTAGMVARVHQAWQQHPARYERIFDEIDVLTRHALDALEAQDLGELGELMNICQGQLNALQVSSREIEELVQLAREHGASGAKLTGGGGGGAVIALCPDGGALVVQAMHDAGYQALEVSFG